MKRLGGSILSAGLAGGDGAVVRKVERAVGFTATAILVVLHLVLLAHAGGLWRDEANLVNLSSMPPREVWANLEFDSTPLGYVALLRAWISLIARRKELFTRTCESFPYFIRNESVKSAPQGAMADHCADVAVHPTS